MFGEVPKVPQVTIPGITQYKMLLRFCFSLISLCPLNLFCFSKEEEEGKDIEDTVVNPASDRSTNQIRRKEPQISTTTNYNRLGTKYNEAKTNRSPTRGSEFSRKSDVPNAPPVSTPPPVTELAPEKDVSPTSQAVTRRPPHTLEGTSASLSDVLRFPQMNLSGTLESLNAVSAVGSQEESTDSSEEESLLAKFRLSAGADDASGSSPPTTAVPFTSEDIARGYGFPSETPEAITYHLLIPEPSRNASEDPASSGSEDSLQDPSGEGNAWPPSTPGVMSQADVGSGGDSNYTDTRVEEPEGTAEPSSPGPLLSQGPAVTGMDLPPESASSPTEATPRARTPSSGPPGAVPTVIVAPSQTTQPVYNGETPLQPPSGSGVFPLVTPLLLDSQTLATTPAAWGSEPALHAAPVLPAVGVSLRSLPSSCDGAPLLPSSAPCGSEWRHRVAAGSQTPSPGPSAAESELLPPQAPVPAAGGESLLEPSLAPSSDALSRQARTHAASQTPRWGGGESGALSKTLVLSPAEPSGSDVGVRARSSGPAPPSAFAHDGGSSPAGPAHGPVATPRPGPLLSSPPSAFTAPSASWLQPALGLSGDGEWPGATWEAASLLPDPGAPTALPTPSPVSVAAFPHTTPVWRDADRTRPKSDVPDGNETARQSPSRDAVGRPGGTAPPDLHPNVPKGPASPGDPPPPISSAPAALADARADAAAEDAFHRALGRISQSDSAGPPARAASQAPGDAPRTPVPSAACGPSAPPCPHGTSAAWHPAGALPPPSPADTLLPSAPLAAPGDPVCADTPGVGPVSATAWQGTAPSSAPSAAVLHATSAPAFSAPPASQAPTAGLHGLITSYANEKALEPALLLSQSAQHVVPSWYGDDELSRAASLGVNPAPPPKGRPAVATPVLAMEGPPNTLITELMYSEDVLTSTRACGTGGGCAGLLTAVSDRPVTAGHPGPLGHVYVSMTAVSPSRDGSVATTESLFPSRTTSEPTGSASAYAELVGGGDTSPVADYDDRDRGGSFLNKCMVCSPLRESQERELNDSEPQENSPVGENNLISYSLPEQSGEDTVTGAMADRHANRDGSPDKTPPAAVLPQKHRDRTREDDLQAGRAWLPFTPESKAWAVLTNEEDSGSGQSTSDSLHDNDTSTEFSLPDVSERDVHGVLEAGGTAITPGPPQSSPPTVPSGHSEPFNISEAG